MSDIEKIRQEVERLKKCSRFAKKSGLMKVIIKMLLRRIVA